MACTADGRVDAVVFFWDVSLDREGQFFLNNRPISDKDTAHQDHWLQAFTLQRPRVKAVADSSVSVRAYHDDSTIWFEALPSQLNDELVDTMTTENEMLLKVFDSDRVSQLNYLPYISSLHEGVAAAVRRLRAASSGCPVLHLGDGPLIRHC